MAAVETETVPSEWCQMMGWGVWQQWKQKPSLQSGVGQVMELVYVSSGNKPSLQSGVGQMMELGYGSSGNRNRPFRVVSDDGVGWG